MVSLVLLLLLLTDVFLLLSVLTPQTRRIVQVGGEWEVQMVPDPKRELFHAWGLGLGSTWYTLNPVAMWHAFKLGGTEEGIW